MRIPFSDAVEEVTGRKVIAFMSQVHLDPDMAAEVFVLSPDGEETPSDQEPTAARAKRLRSADG